MAIDINQMMAMKRASQQAQSASRAGAISRNTVESPELTNPYQSYKDHPFLMGLSTLAMGVGEGMTGRPFLTNFNNNLYEQKQAQLKYKQWQQEQDIKRQEIARKIESAPMDMFLKQADIAEKMIAMGLATPEQVQAAMGKTMASSQEPQMATGSEPVTMRGGIPEGFEVTGVKRNKFGVLEPEYGKVKPSAAQEKRDVENRELTDQTKNILSLFNDARKEASSIEGFGKGGFEGRIANQLAIAKGKLGDMPTLNVFQDRVSAFATTTAKAAGEVRPTDADIKRFSKALVNFSANDKENAVQMAQILKDVKSKGHSVSWAESLVREYENTTGVKVKFDFSDKPEIKKFKSVSEAESANLPKGTIVEIDGRKARID